MSLSEVAQQLQQAEAGRATTLVKLDANLKPLIAKHATLGEILQQLHKDTQNQTDADESNERAWARVHVIISEAGEKIGDFFLPIIRDLGITILGTIQEISDFGKAVSKGFGEGIDAAKALGTAIADLAGIVADLVSHNWADIGNKWNDLRKSGTTAWRDVTAEVENYGKAISIVSSNAYDYGNKVAKDAIKSYSDVGSGTVTGPSGSTTITATHYSTRVYDPTTHSYNTTDDGSNYTGGGSTSMTTPSNTDGNQQIAVTPTFSGGTNAWTFVQVKRPDGTTASFFSTSTNNDVTTYYFQTYQVGVHTIIVGANPIASTWDGTGTAGTSSNSTTSWTSTVSYSVRDTTGHNGSAVTICTTPGSTVAPVDSAHQLSLNITALSAPSDANGATRIDVQLKNPSGAIVQSWTGVSTGTLTYYTGAATAGAYTWQYTTVVTSTTNQGTATYAGSITATPSWYQSDAQIYTIYSNNDGAGHGVPDGELRACSDICRYGDLAGLELAELSVRCQWCIGTRRNAHGSQRQRRLQRAHHDDRHVHLRQRWRDRGAIHLDALRPHQDRQQLRRLDLQRYGLRLYRVVSERYDDHHDLV